MPSHLLMAQWQFPSGNSLLADPTMQIFGMRPRVVLMAQQTALQCEQVQSPQPFSTAQWRLMRRGFLVSDSAMRIWSTCPARCASG